MPGKMLWIDTFLTQATASASQSAQDLAAQFTSEATRLAQMTLMRMIVRLDIAYTVHDSGEGSQRVGIGFGIESQEAFAAGVHPDPLTTGDFPARGWTYRGVWRVFGFAADQPAVDVARVDFDIRARRKLENGVSFVVIDNQAVEGVASAITVLGIVRQLWLVS